MFYSLSIQSYVRNTLLIVAEWQETLSTAVLEANTSSKFQKYLHLAIRLFAAISAGNDPLAVDWSSNHRIAQSAEEIALVGYYIAAQKVMECNTWKRNNINSSFAYLSDIFDDDGIPDKKNLVSRRYTPTHDFNRSCTSLANDSDDGSSIRSQCRNILRSQSSYGADDDGDLSTGEISGLRGLHINTRFGSTPGRSSPTNNAGTKRKRSSLPHTYDSLMLQKNGSAGSSISGLRRGSYSSTLSLAASSVGSGYGQVSPGGILPISDFSDLPWASVNSRPKSSSVSGSLSNCEDTLNFPGRPNMESDKHLDSDADFPMEETSGLRRLRIDDTANS